MKRIFLIVLLMCGLSMPARAEELAAPSAPDSALELMPSDTESFGEGLFYVIKNAVQKLRPELVAGCGICLSVMGIMMLTSILDSLPGKAKGVTELAGTVAVVCLLLGNANTLVGDATNTVTELSEYGKLLLPVLTGWVLKPQYQNTD